MTLLAAEPFHAAPLHFCRNKQKQRAETAPGGAGPCDCPGAIAGGGAPFGQRTGRALQSYAAVPDPARAPAPGAVLRTARPAPPGAVSVRCAIICQKNSGVFKNVAVADQENVSLHVIHAEHRNADHDHHNAGILLRRQLFLEEDAREDH